MAVAEHIRTLRDKHASLDLAISRETAHSSPDTIKVTEWKREKLRIKDAIADLQRQL